MKKQNRRLENLKYEFQNNRQAIFALSFLIFILLVSLLVVFSPIDPNAINVSNKFLPPDPQHLFGTDEMGRDYFIRVLYGGRISLLVAFLAMLTSIVIGATVGLILGS